MAICLGSLFAAAQQVGIVHNHIIIKELPGYSKAQETINATSAGYQAELTLLRNEIDKKYAEYQQLDPKTDAAIFLRRQQELQDLDQKYQKFFEESARRLQEQRNTLIGNLEEEINHAINTVGDRDNYLVIFTDDNAPAYLGKEVIDLTDAVRLVLMFK